MLPVTGTLDGAVDVEEDEECSEAGESQPRLVDRGSSGDAGEVRFGVEVLSPLDDDEEV